MSIATLLEELIKADPEDAPMIKELVAKENEDGLMCVLFARAASYMNAKLFILELEKGEVASVLRACRRASEISDLAYRVKEQ